MNIPTPTKQNILLQQLSSTNDGSNMTTPGTMNTSIPTSAIATPATTTPATTTPAITTPGITKSSYQNSLLQQLMGSNNGSNTSTTKIPVPLTTTPGITSSPYKKSIDNLSNGVNAKNKLILERLKLENSQIDDYIQILNNQRNTERSAMDYDSYYYNLLDNVFTPLFVLYLLAVVGLGYFLFMMENEYSMGTKMLIIFAFILYPFVIEFIEDTVISWFRYFSTLLAFTPSGTNPIKTATDSQPFLYSQRVNIMDS